MQLDPKTRHTLGKAIPVMFETEYTREDLMYILRSVYKRMNYKKYRADARLDAILTQVEQFTDDSTGLINVLLDYVRSDDIRRHQLLGGHTTYLIPIAWGLHYVQQQTRILKRLGRPFNKQKNAYRRERDRADRLTENNRLFIFGGDYAILKAVALAYRGKEPWEIEENDLL